MCVCVLTALCVFWPQGLVAAVLRVLLGEGPETVRGCAERTGSRVQRPESRPAWCPRTCASASHEPVRPPVDPRE